MFGSPTHFFEESNNDCVKGERRPNGVECTTYLICSNSELLTRPCPEGLHFNAALLVCDYPANARCQAIPAGEANACPTNDVEKFLGHPNCDKYYVCNYGVPYEQRCSNGLHWSIAENTCDWKESANCTEGESPAQPGAVLLPQTTPKPDPYPEVTDSYESF